MRTHVQISANKCKYIMKACRKYVYKFMCKQTHNLAFIHTYMHENKDKLTYLHLCRLTNKQIDSRSDR